MHIAVASQNRREVTAHLGRCRRFWIYDIEGEHVKGKHLVELPKEQSLHESHAGTHPIYHTNVVIAGGMGEGMVHRLASRHIDPVVTPEKNPEVAVAAYLAGTLERGTPESHGQGHDHNHDEED